MPEGAARASEDQGISRLEVSRILRGDPSGLCAALDDPSWLGPLVDGPSEHPHLRRVETDLAFSLASEPRTVTFRKAAYVDLGTIRRDGSLCAGEVGWQASTFAPLFPVFAGTIEIRDGGLHLEGVYAPPGGGIGLLVDRGLLHHFARRTAVWFLDRLSDELAARSAEPPPPRA